VSELCTGVDVNLTGELCGDVCPREVSMGGA
jgi:hypothetical protein